MSCDCSCISGVQTLYCNTVCGSGVREQCVMLSHTDTFLNVKSSSHLALSESGTEGPWGLLKHTRVHQTFRSLAGYSGQDTCYVICCCNFCISHLISVVLGVFSVWMTNIESLWWEWQAGHRGICCYCDSKKAGSPLQPWVNCESREGVSRSLRVLLPVQGRRKAVPGWTFYPAKPRLLTVLRNSLHSGTMELISSRFTLTFPPAQSPGNTAIALCTPVFDCHIHRIHLEALQLWYKASFPAGCNYFSNKAFVPSHRRPQAAVVATAATILVMLFMYTRHHMKFSLIKDPVIY